ncbi:MAG: ATP-binding cassette domain-containing protein [Chitinophagaceae bacterium]|nr:ATP-binding cassette domain-containing protein [Chitinophagaceae bacterium]
MKISLQHITKRFGREVVINDFTHEFTSPASIALLGANGSGKSTLLQIIAGYVQASKGEIHYTLNGKELSPEKTFQSVSYCAPYLELIEEMTLSEFLHFHFSFKKPLLPISDIIRKIGLESSSDKLLEHMSSGMKQRVKLAQALFADTLLILLDEPCTNLDEEGYALYRELVKTCCTNRLLIVASNDKNEYEVCSTFIHLKDYKS